MHARFTTYERVEAARLIVVKRDGTRQEFDRDKLAAGLAKALTRRPVPDDAADARRGRDRGRAPGAGPERDPVAPGSARWRWRGCARSTTSRTSGSPSVYQSFEDLEDLKREVDTLFAEHAVTPKKGKRA